MKNHFLILLFSLSVCYIFGQNKKDFLLNKKGIFLMPSLGLSLSPGASQLKEHLKKNNFDDLEEPSFLCFCGPKQYPITKPRPFKLDLTLLYVLRKYHGLSLTVGFGHVDRALGYTILDGPPIEPFLFIFDTIPDVKIDLSHRSWFLSPQYSFAIMKGRFNFFVGPTINQQILSRKWQAGNTIKVKQRTIGFNLGMRINTRSLLTYEASFLWMPNQKFAESSYYYRGETIIFPEKEINAMSLRAGLVFNIHLIKFPGKKLK